MGLSRRLEEIEQDAGHVSMPCNFVLVRRIVATEREYMAFVSSTRLRVRSWRYLFGFTVHSLRSSLQARRVDGCYAVLLLREDRNTFWTCTVWRDDKAMRTFMTAGAHMRAMPKLLEWCDEASVVHWLQENIEAPSWDEIHRRMQVDGRRSKVNHPSEAHLAYQLPPPRVKRTSQLRFK